MKCTAKTIYSNYLYAIADKQNNLIKIGYTKDPVKRCSQLQTGNPNNLEIVWYVQISQDRAKIVENKIHKEYNYKRVRGEWFKMTVNEATEILNHAIIRWEDDPLL